MLNKKMYLRLVQLYESQVSPRSPNSLSEVRLDAMCLNNRPHLTRGEKQACQEVFEIFKALY